MHGRRRFRVFSRIYKRLKNKVRRHHRQRRDAKLCKADIEKWKSEVPFADADFVSCKWQATRPNSERVPFEYDCSCHGTNKPLVANHKPRQMASSLHRDQIENLAMGIDQCSVKDQRQQYIVPDSDIQIHSAPAPESARLTMTHQDNKATNSPNTVHLDNFSTKHSKHMRQYQDISRSPCQTHPDSEPCSCQPAAEFSAKKDTKQKLKSQKKWEKQKRLWQRQASYKQRGRNYQILDDEGSEFQHTPEYEQFERALDDELDKFQLRRSEVKKEKEKKKAEPRPQPRHSKTKSQGQGHIHEHGDHSNCSCQAVVEYSRMMDKKYEELKKEKDQQDREKIEQVKKLQEQDRIEVLTSEASVKTSKQNKASYVQSSSVEEISPFGSPSRNLLTRSKSETKEVQKPNPTSKLGTAPHMHDHESCSCRIVKEYSKKMDQEYEERRRKLNEKPVMDNNVNALKEQEIKGQAKGKKKSKLKKLISHTSTHEVINPDMCSRQAVKEYTMEKELEQQHHKKGILRSQSEVIGDGVVKARSTERPKSTPTEIIDKTIAFDRVDEPEFNIRIYKGYKKSCKTCTISGDEKDDTEKEVDPSNVCLHPDDWTPVKSTPEKDTGTFALVEWDKAISPTSETPCRRSANKSNTLACNPEKWTQLKTPKKNKARSHVHTLNLSEWSASAKHKTAKNTKFKHERKDEVDPCSIHLDPEDWTPVKEVYRRENATESNACRLIEDPSDWTPVKTSKVHSPDGSEVPHKAADIYNQYAAKYQVSLPADNRTSRKQVVEPQHNTERICQNTEHTTGYLPVELWEPDKKALSEPVSCTHMSAPATSSSGQMSASYFEDNFVSVSSPVSSNSACIPSETADQASPNPFIDNFVLTSSSDMHTTASNPVQMPWNPFEDNFVPVPSKNCDRGSCSGSHQTGEIAVSPNDSGCFSLGSPLSDSGLTKSFMSSSGVQEDVPIQTFTQSKQSVTEPSQSFSWSTQPFTQSHVSPSNNQTSNPYIN